MDKTTRDKIVSQALNEISFDRDAKQYILPRWERNDRMYLGIKKEIEGLNRNNINLNEAQSFVQTFLSKINNPYNFKFEKGQEADLEPAKVVNAIKDKDSKSGMWNAKIRRARKEMIKYGRYIMEYHADSDDGYCSYLSNVPCYQFLIDPSCGGDDIEKAYHLGRGNIIKSKKQIEKGVKSKLYLADEAKELLSGAGNGNFVSQEDDAQNMWVTMANKKIITNPDQYKFWEWYTTYEDERYYVLVTENGGKAIRVELLTDMFPSGKYPFFTASSDDDLTEFWNPSPLDGVIEPIIAKSISINQFLDNAEAINRPMKAFNVNAIEDPMLLEYRTDGLIPVKAGFDAQKDIQFFQTVALNPTMTVYDKLDEIVSVQSGVTNGARGQASEDKVGIYEGNQANAADRFTLIQDSEAEAQYRFATLYLEGLDEHMTKSIAVMMIGPDGVQYSTKVTKKDMKRHADFDINIITAGAEQTMQGTEKRNKLTFLQNKQAAMIPGAPSIWNPKVLGEMEATIAGFTQEEVNTMMDKNYGNSELMSEAARDIQDILDGKTVKPNIAANVSYAQKIQDWMVDNAENITPEQFMTMDAYVESLMPIVMKNMNNSIDEQLAAEGLPSQPGIANGLIGQAPVPGATPAPMDTQIPQAGQSIAPALANPAQGVQYQ